MYTRTLFAILSLLFLGLAPAEQNYQLKTLTELKFDKEIQDVAFDSYEQNGQIKYYPKIVVLREIDSIASKGPFINYELEVRILDRVGKTIWNLTNLKFWSNVYLSKYGKYFGVYTAILQDPSVNYEERRVTKSNYAIYDDKGKKRWELPLLLDYDYPTISSYDGSFFLTFSGEGLTAGEALDHFDKYGRQNQIIPPHNFDAETYKHISSLEFSDDGKVVVAPIWEGGEFFTKRLILTMFDFTGNLLWEYPIDETDYGDIKVSSKGSYIFAPCYTWTSTQESLTEKTKEREEKTITRHQIEKPHTFVLNRLGELVIKTPTRSLATEGAFSDNERYLHFRDSKLGEPNYLVLIDLESKKEMFRKELPERPLQAWVSDSGWVIEMCMAPQGNKFKLYFLNNEGSVITQCAVQLKKEDISNFYYEDLKILGWCGNYPVFGLVEDKSKTIKILSLAK
jgi:hypothetical protein